MPKLFGKERGWYIVPLEGDVMLFKKGKKVPMNISVNSDSPSPISINTSESAGKK